MSFKDVDPCATEDATRKRRFGRAKDRYRTASSLPAMESGYNPEFIKKTCQILHFGYFDVERCLVQRFTRTTSV